MRIADRLIVPSGFLKQVFRRFALSADIVPNIIDLSRFAPSAGRDDRTHPAPHLIVTRNLESIYDIGTALRAFAIVRAAWPQARMTIAGSGPDRAGLERLARDLGVADDVVFAGRIENEHIAGLYREADLCLNPSLVDNMPISILESLASGVPVVTTNAGGIPFVVEHDKTALLVPCRDPEAMARAACGLLADPLKAHELARAGRESAQKYTWSQIRPLLLDVYLSVTACPRSGRPAEIK